MKYLKITFNILGLAAICSVILYAGFDITWWKPLGQYDAARGTGLLFLHFLLIGNFLLNLAIEQLERQWKC